jgi:hypothetical protein
MVGLSALAAHALGLWLSPDAFFRGYLTGYTFWLGVAVGSLAILMVHQLTGGAWGYLLRHVLQAAVRTLPLMALLFVPLAFGLEHLYPWARPGAMADDTLLAAKASYLNPHAFRMRAAVYFAVWLVLGLLLNRWLGRIERTDDPAAAKRARVLSGPGIVLYWLAVTFASVDWLMSIQPHWYSTMFPVVFAVSQLIVAYAFAVLVTTIFAARPPMQQAATPKRMRDLGNLMLMLVMFWAYVAFSQFMLIWIGNLPDEILWYTPRFSGVWRWVAIAVMGLQFGLPFLLLLLRKVKQTRPVMRAICMLLLATGVVNLVWQIVPGFLPGDLLHRWPEVATSLWAVLGVGGVWLAVVLGSLSRQPVLPADSHLLPEAPHHG